MKTLVIKPTTNSNRKFVCLISLHTDEIIKELLLINARGNEIGIVFVNRCSNCGRIKSTKVVTVEHL